MLHSVGSSPSSPAIFLKRGDIIGIIYQIKNTINNKLYIGMTTRDIETRKSEHRKSFNNSNLRMYDFKLYRAMRKYGFENFEFSTVEECPDIELKTRERYYISLYDTVANGYNEAIGGAGKPIWTDKQIEAFKVLYENGWILQDIAKIFNSNPKTISNKLRCYYNINTKQNSNILNARAVTGTNETETINFKSMSDAARYLIKNNLTNNTSVVSISGKIREVIDNQKRTAYGFKWMNSGE